MERGASEPGPERAASPDWSERALLAVLLLCYGWLFVFFPRINNPNELVRVYMARALAERGTYAIGERVAEGGRFLDVGPLLAEWGYVNDKALVCHDPRLRPPACAGTLYAAKAPGTSFLAAPIVALLRVAAGLLAHRAPDKTELVFALRWLLGILPSVALWIAVRRFLLGCGVAPRLALIAALAGGCGSLSLTYGQMVAGHQAGSVALGLAFFAAFWPGRVLKNSPVASRTMAALLVGVGAGAAICIEYPCAPAAALIVAGFLWFVRPGWRGIGLAALGALPPLLLLAHFHGAAFGAPWRTPYSFLENPGFVRDLAPGFLGISPPTWERVYGSLASPFLGLFFWAPWTALALPAGAWFVRDLRNPLRPPLAAGGGPLLIAGAGITAAAVVAYYLVFQITHALWRSGWTVGPRYVTPLVPFAAIVIALALARAGEASRQAPALFAGAAAAGIAATGLASAVCQGFPLEVYNPLVEVVFPLLSHGYVPRNLLQLAGVPGVWSALPQLATLAAAIALCLAAGARAAGGRRGLLIACATFAGLTLAQWTANGRGGAVERSAARFLAESWEPAPPPGARPLDSF